MDNNNNNNKPGIFKRIPTYFIKKFDRFIINYLTVSRPSGKRKYIWHTRQFREVANFHVPRIVFLFIACMICWKIKEKVKTLKGCSVTNYQLKSFREDVVAKEEEVINNYNIFMNIILILTY